MIAGKWLAPTYEMCYHNNDPFVVEIKFFRKERKGNEKEHLKAVEKESLICACSGIVFCNGSTDYFFD